MRSNVSRNDLISRVVSLYWLNIINNSRGVALLFPYKSECTIEGYAYDDDGRRLIVHLQNQGCKLTIVNVYAPTQDCASEQGNFYKDLQSEWEDLDLNHTVIG